MTAATPQKWNSQRIARAFVWGGALITAVGLLWASSTLWFVSRAEKAQATLVDWEVTTSNSRGSNGFSTRSSSYSAIVEFQDASGIRHRAKSPRPLNHRKWELGTQMPVFYDTKTPDEMLLDDADLLWFGPGVITGFGVFALLLSGLALRLLKRFETEHATAVQDIMDRFITKKPR